MRAFLIDAENVNIEQFFSISGFEKDDKFYIIGNTTLKFSTKILQFLQERKYKIYTFETPRKDYADKMIFTILGAILNDDEIHEFLIISNDKIFENLDFVEEIFNKKIKNIKFQPNQTTQKSGTNLAQIKPKIECNKNDSNTKLALTNIEIFIKQNQFMIDLLRNLSINKQNFHTHLVQKFGKEKGREIYIFMRDSDKIGENFIEIESEICEFCKEKSDEISKLKQSAADRLSLHNLLVQKYGEIGKKLYKILKNIGE